MTPETHPAIEWTDENEFRRRMGRPPLTDEQVTTIMESEQ